MVLTLRTTGSGDLVSWKADADYLIKSVFFKTSSAVEMILGTNPTLIAGSIPAVHVREDIFALLSLGSTAGINGQQIIVFDQPLPEGTNLYFSAGGTAYCCVYLELLS